MDYDRARRLVERAVGITNVVIGAFLTLGGLALAINWRLRFGGFGSLRAFYLYTAWSFGALELFAATAMFRRWPVRWVVQMLPMIVPIVAYQYFVLRFIFRRI
jgi:hypothetical protein